MKMHLAVGTAAVVLSVASQANAALEPHVDADGSVSWTATIDAATVAGFFDANSGAVEADSKRIAALGRWLDAQLAAVSWCKRGWMYRTTDANYIEPLDDGGLRVRGLCHRS